MWVEGDRSESEKVERKIAMAFAERIEDLEIWQSARILHHDVWFALTECRDYSFRDQMRRAALSVMNNIAEGFERRTPKDFAHFPDQSKGSAGEVRSMTYAAQDIARLSLENAEKLRDQSELPGKRIAAFTRLLRN